MSVKELKFKFPFTCIVAGTTGSGKTCWTRRLLASYKYLIDFEIRHDLKVLWCFGQYQKLYNEPIIDVDITYSKGIPSLDTIKQSQPNIIVIDDLMTELRKDEIVKDLFIRGSHHLNISVIYITQNIFASEKPMRTISLNAQYIVILKGIRLTQQIAVLGAQIFPGKARNFLNIYKSATAEPFSYLLLDLHPSSQDKFRLRNRIFKQELPKNLAGKFDSSPIFYPIDQ